MPRTHDTHKETSEVPGTSTAAVVELYPPVDDDGWYTSQVRDWVAVCPELGDSAVRLYVILRSLVIDKYGPVRKLTLAQLCLLLPKKPVPPGHVPERSSVSRIRGLLDQLTRVGLVTTPEGHRLTTSSRALAAGQGLRMRINLMPRRSYAGPRNAFALLDDIRQPAADLARAARARELELAAARRAARQEPPTSDGAGQNSGPAGQNFDPRGQNSDPDSGTDQQDRDAPLSLPAQSSLTEADASVRPSPQVGEEEVIREEGGTGGQAVRPAGEGRNTAAPLPGGTPDAGPVQREPLPAARPAVTVGLEILYQLGQRVPALALAGRPLADQARRLNELVASTPWTPATLLAALAAPFEGPVRVSAGGVVSARISALPAAPALPAVQQGEPKGSRRSVAEEVARRVMPECVECGRPPVPGNELCQECAGWPLCPSCHRRRSEDGAVCRDCASAARVAEPVAQCAGHDGTSCGAPLLEIGPLGPLCGPCEYRVRRARAERDRRWDDAVRAAAAAAAAAGEPQVHSAHQRP
ncbi:hypothetical protein ABZ926_35865 [Streptomyces litmocidini]|uniref:hypothetical protein n=1 Tax=Streptomyces litmocidini TaxID=67318 RepID=UPI0033F7B680